MYNKIGADNERQQQKCRATWEIHLPGACTPFISLSDAHSVDVGARFAYTPRVKIDEKAERYLAGIDITYRYVPLSQAGYRGLVWGTEVLFNRENRPVGGFPTDPTIPPPTVFERNNAWGLYTYLEARLSRRFYPGFLFDYAQALDSGVGDTKAYSPYLTIWLSGSSASAVTIPIRTRYPSASPRERILPAMDSHPMGAMHMASVTARGSL
jgi:hypothetical protein